VIPIPGIVIAVLTFPGVIAHEAAHLFFCRLFGLGVFEVRYFRLANPAGYVVHQQPTTFRAAFFVGIAPFLVNSLLCFLFCLPAVLPVVELELRDPLAYFFAWLGVSIGMHAFPSDQDLANVWRLAGPAARRREPLALLSYPLVALLRVADFGRRFWLDYLWGLAIGIFGPLLLLRWLA